MEWTFNQIEALVKLVTDQKLDQLTIGELEIKKSLHESKDTMPVPLSPINLSNEDLLFAAGADRLPPEIVEAFIRRPRRSRENND